MNLGAWIVAAIATVVVVSGVGTAVALTGNAAEVGGNTVGAIIQAIPNAVQGFQDAMNPGE